MEIKPRTTFQRRIGSAQGVFYSGYATVLKDDIGEVTIMGKDMNELIQRWYSMTDVILDIETVEVVALFSESAVKLKDYGDAENAVAVDLMSKD